MTVRGTGKGGRNQEFAFAAVARIWTRWARAPCWRSVGTDGIDGPTDAAGAVVDSSTLDARRAPPGWRRPRPI